MVNFEYYTTRRFGQANPELWPRSWKLNGNIFFELFVSDLDQKNDLGGLRTTQKRKQKQRYRLSDKPIIIQNSPFGVLHAKRKYSLTLDNFSLSSHNWSQSTFFILVDVLTSICERFWASFDQINIPPRRPSISSSEYLIQPLWLAY